LVGLVAADRASLLDEGIFFTLTNVYGLSLWFQLSRLFLQIISRRAAAAKKK
jgi:hypothetical protein